MCWGGWLSASWSGMNLGNLAGKTGAAPFCSVDVLPCMRLTQACSPDDGRGREWVNGNAQARIRTVFASYLLVSTAQGKSQGQTCFGNEACALIGHRYCFLRVVLQSALLHRSYRCCLRCLHFCFPSWLFLKRDEKMYPWKKLSQPTSYIWNSWFFLGYSMC